MTFSILDYSNALKWLIALCHEQFIVKSKIPMDFAQKSVKNIAEMGWLAWVINSH